MQGSFSTDLIDAGLYPKSAVTVVIKTLSVLKVFGENSKVSCSKLIYKITWTAKSAREVAKIT